MGSEIAEIRMRRHGPSARRRDRQATVAEVSSAGERSLTTTSNPRAARATAVARPSPRPAPVTIATGRLTFGHHAPSRSSSRAMIVRWIWLVPS